MRFIIVDIDGTIADISHRLPYLLKDKPLWDEFYLACPNDKPIWGVIELVKLLFQNGKNLIFVTGRDELIREQTTAWIKEYVGIAVNETSLLMRKRKDNRPDEVVKKELLEQAGVKMDSIEFVLEDRKGVVDMWRKNNVLCLQVADGNF